MILNIPIILENNTQGKAVRVTGCGGPQCREMSRLPHFLGNRLADGDDESKDNRKCSITIILINYIG
jgi:hypothetical protein